MNYRVTLIVIAAVVAIACTDAAPPPIAVKSSPTPRAVTSSEHDHGAEPHAADRISLADAKKEFDAQTAVFIDTHSPEQYAQRHIPGSINVPANDIEPYLNKIPKGKKLIAYCS